MKQKVFFFVTVVFVILIIGSTKHFDKPLEMYKGQPIIFSSRDYDTTALDSVYGYIDSTGVHMRAGWFDSLNVDVFDTLGAYLDTNTNTRDSVHVYQEATDSLATPKVKVDIITPKDSDHVTIPVKIWAANFREDETINHTIFVGNDAGKENTGMYSSFLGQNAGLSNTGASSNAFGYGALRYNEGVSSNAFGHDALRSNTGVSSNAFGHYALRSNTGVSSNAFGHDALRFNTGAYSNAFGHYALRSNTGAYSNAFGHYALYSNTGAYSNAFGYGALRYNEGINNIGIGSESFNLFNLDAGSAKTFDYTDIEAETDYITIAGHDFGNIGSYRNLKYTQGTSAITGISDGVIYKFKIIDANTLELYLINIIDAGTGTGHAFTPQYIYSNSVAIGHNAEPTASNQVMIGGSTINSVILNGGTIAKSYNFADASVVGGTGDAITLDFDPEFPSLTAGLKICFISEAANTGATTLTIDGGDTKNIYEASDISALEANDIKNGMAVELLYDGTQWQQISQSGN